MDRTCNASNPIDTSALKRAHPIADVVGSYGIELRPIGRSLVGRCPFHDDRGRPNLTVYPATASYYCYRCAEGGDTITFVARMESVGFREAVARLGAPTPAPRRHQALAPQRLPARRCRPAADWGGAERACAAAAVELYHNALLGTPEALTYVEGRGIDRTTIVASRLGYVTGGELPAYLAWRRLPAGAALRIGLLGPEGVEPFAGRVVVPEIRGGQPIWLVGRGIGAETMNPKYLGLPGAKPLLGWETAAGSPTAVVVEGAFDWLTLRMWGLPALALVGTRVRPEVLHALATRFQRLYLALDADEAGQTAMAAFQEAMGVRAVPVRLPPGVKDVADLAPLPGAQETFAGALLLAAQGGDHVSPAAVAA